MDIDMSKRVLTRWILVFGYCVYCSMSAVAADPKVRGKVVDQDGNPVSHAYIEARPIINDLGKGTVVGNGPNPWIAADDSGQFEILLPAGRYRIQGKAEVDGFPDPTFWLNVDPKARFPVISVANKDVTDVEVVLGRQGGILHGLVQDADTPAPISNARLRLQDARNSNAFVEIFTNQAGQFEYTVPSKPILISAEAKGYKRVTVQNGGEVILAPGEHREIDIDLHHE